MPNKISEDSTAKVHNSIFYDELFSPHIRFPVPLLAIEVYAEASKTAESDDDIINALDTVLIRVCRIESPSQEDYQYLVTRLQEMSNIQGAAPVNRGRSFGTAFADYLGQLPTIDLLGAMTNYDLDKMRRLYCEIDFSHARSFIRSFTDGLLEKNVVAYEASLYGAGGNYKNDSVRAANNAVDANSKEGMAMMRQFGIGSVSDEALAELGFKFD